MSSEGKTRSGIEGYKLLSKLGKGGMATVYLGIQECFERQVAIKVMHPNPHDKSHGERFIHEAKIVAKLNHPNIVSVYDVGVSGKYHYMAMEYLQGGDLSQRIEQGLNIEQAIEITKALASALDYAHSKGFLHRDVKPDNILFKEDGTAVLTDFGIAKAKSVDTKLTQIGQVIGTPKYMSPEQSKGGKLDAQSDLYALGVLFYEMLTGQVPFDGDDALAIGIKHLKDPAPPLPENLQKYQSIINKLLAKNPEKRFASGQALIDALNSTTTTFNEEPELMPENNNTSFSALKEDRPENLNPNIKAKPTQKSRLLPVTILLLMLVAGFFAAVFFAPNIAPQNAWLMTMHKQLQQQLNPKLAKLEKLLAQGEKALTEQRFLSPPKNNALYYFTQTLALDNNNAAATSGLDRLEKHYIEQALTDIKNRNFSGASLALDSAHSIRGETETISQTRKLLAAAEKAEESAKQQAAAEKAKRLAAEKAARENAEEEKRLAAKRQAEKAAAAKAAREKQLAEEQAAAKLAAEKQAAAERLRNIRITGLLNKAKTYMTRGDYRSPAKENALEKYQAVLALDPNNKEATQGIDQVVQKLLPELKRLHDAQQISMAQNLFDQLINAAPDHPELIAIGQQYGW